MQQRHGLAHGPHIPADEVGGQPARLTGAFELVGDQALIEAGGNDLPHNGVGLPFAAATLAWLGRRYPASLNHGRQEGEHILVGYVAALMAAASGRRSLKCIHRIITQVRAHPGD